MVFVDASQTPVKFSKWLLLITLLAAALRLLWLSQPSIWLDEIFSVRDAVRIFQNPVVSTIEKVRIIGYLPMTLGLYLSGVDLGQIDSTSPSMWLAQGVTPWALRIVPALIGIITIPLLAIASRRILGARTTLVLVLLLAVAPWHIYWSQMGRFYVTQFLFYNLALIFYFTATWEGSRQLLLWAMGCFVLAFASQYTSAVFFLVIGGDWILSKLRRDRLKLDRMGYLIIILTAFLFGAMLLIFVGGDPETLTKKLQVHENPSIQFAYNTLHRIGPMVIVAAFLTQLMRGVSNRRIDYYLLLGAVIPVIVYSMLSFRGQKYSRYAFICFYPWLALAAIGLTYVYEQLRPRIGIIFAWMPLILLLTSMFAVNLDYYFYNIGFRSKKNRIWNKAADYVRNHYHKGEKVIINKSRIGKYYLSDLGDQVLVSPNQVKGIDQPIWIVTRESKSEFMHHHPVLSKAQLQTTFVRKSEKPKYKIHVYYLPSMDEE